MRKILIILFLMFGIQCFSQTHVEYVSEPTDSMALINKQDIDVINNVFRERNVLDSLRKIDAKIIETLEINNNIQKDIIVTQDLAIQCSDELIKELEVRNEESVAKYSKQLKKEKIKSVSFETLTGAGIIVIILLILL